MSKLPDDLDRQIENVARRIELLRLRWLKDCEATCFPPVALELELLEREFKDLVVMVRGNLSA